MSVGAGCVYFLLFVLFVCIMHFCCESVKALCSETKESCKLNVDNSNVSSSIRSAQRVCFKIRLAVSSQYNTGKLHGQILDQTRLQQCRKSKSEGLNAYSCLSNSFSND